MPYSAEISRPKPTCFLFLIDQSGSMADPFGGETGKSKAEGVADAINRLLQTLMLRCSKNEGVRDYFHLGVIGYGPQVGPAFGGALAGRALVPISEVDRQPLRVETRNKEVSDGAGSVRTDTIQFPVWFDPVAGNGTPMAEALELARQTVAGFIGAHPKCFPPIVLNITDGAANSSPEAAAKAIRELATPDGNVLLFNLHISEVEARPIMFPADESGLPDDYARLLFRMSSPLPPQAIELARSEKLPVSAASRGFVFNGSLVSVVKFLDIGTRVNVKNMR